MISLFRRAGGPSAGRPPRAGAALALCLAVALPPVAAAGGSGRAAKGPTAAAAGPAWREYFPFAENTHWVYTFTNKANGRQSTITRHVNRGKPIAGLKMKDPRIFDEKTSSESNPVVYFEDDGGYLVEFIDAKYGAGGALDLPPKFGSGVEILPPHLTVGTEWSQRAIVVAWVRWKHRVVGKETVKVPAGEFSDCYRVEATLGPDGDSDVDHMLEKLGMFRYHYDDWYARGVGLVKSETRMVDSGELVSSEELQSYRLPPAAGTGPSVH